MADKFVLRNEAAPIVSISGDDGDATDVIHHDVKKMLGGSATVINASEAVGTAKWYVALNFQIGATLIPPVVNGNYSDGTAHNDNDHIMAYYIKNLGVDENGDTIAGYIDLCRSSQAAPLIRLYPGESSASRLVDQASMDVGSFKVYNDNDYIIMVDIVCFCDYTP